MGAGSVQVPPDSTGKKIDCASVTAGGQTVYRQAVVIADPTSSTGYATVTGGALKVTGTIDKISATVAVSGQVSLGPGTSNIGTINNISAAVTLAAGSANIGSINNISATVGITGTVALIAGTAHIGEVNISVFPALVAGTANIGAVSLAAGTSNIGFLNGISATVTVVNSGFFDSSAGSTTLVRVGDSANSAMRVNVVAGGSGGGIVTGPVAPGASVTAGNNPVLMGGTDGTFARVIKTDTSGNIIVSGISATAVCVSSGFYDSSSGSTTTVRVGDSANSAVRCNVVAGTLAMSGMLDGVSATVNVTGTVYITGNVHLSASTTAAVGTSAPLWVDKSGRLVTVGANPSLPPSATHGPKYCGAISASGGAQLLAAPGAGTSLFITNIQWSNLNATTGTILFVYEGSATATPLLVTWVPGNNAGSSIYYDPPARISANTKLSAKVKPNVDGIPVNVHFFTGVD